MIMSSKKVNTDDFDTFDYTNAQDLKFRNCFLARYTRKTPLLKYKCGHCGKTNRCRLKHEDVVHYNTFHKCKKCGVENLIPITVHYYF